MQENKVIQGFELFLSAIELLEVAFDTSFFEAYIENGANIIENYTTKVEGNIPNKETIGKLDSIYKRIKELALEPEEWRKIIQLALLKGGQAEAIQANHRMTPDSIAFLFAYFIEQLSEKNLPLRILDNTLGSGNLLLGVMNQLKLANHSVKGIGVENDDTLIHIATVNTQLCQAKIELFHQDGANLSKEVQADISIGDLPIGYYPNDAHAQNFLVSSKEEHTYAHHLLVESAMNHTKENGFGLFLLPNNLFTSGQNRLFKNWLSQKTYLQAVIQLPKTLFKQKNAQKSIYIFQNKGEYAKQQKVLAMNLLSLKEPTKIQELFTEFADWKKNCDL